MVAIVTQLDAGGPFLFADGGTAPDVTLTLGASGIGASPSPNGQARPIVRF